MALRHDEQELLARLFEFFQRELLDSPRAQDVLRQLGDPEGAFLEKLQVGLVTPDILSFLPEEEVVASAVKELGFLDAQGQDRFGHQLIFPLRSPRGHWAGYGTLDPESRQETLILFEPLGCFCPARIRKAKRVYLTTSAVDAFLLTRMGDNLAFVADAREAAQSLKALTEHSIQEVVLALDDPQVADACARILRTQGIEPMGFSLPAGTSLRAALQKESDPENLLGEVVPMAVSSEKPDIQRKEDQCLFAWPDRSYRVRLVEPDRFDHLRVSLKVTKENRWHLDTIDLGLAKQRHAFIRAAKKLVRIEQAVLYQDLLSIAEEMERDQANRILAAKPGEKLSDQARQEAERFLSDPQLFEHLAQDLKDLGWWGDPRLALLGYLVLTSRKLFHPLALAWRDQEEPLDLSGVLLPLLPEGELLYADGLSSKLLRHMEDDAFKQKLMVSEKESLPPPMRADLKRLVRGEPLWTQAIIRDPQTGKMRAVARPFRGPCAAFVIAPGFGQKRKPKPLGSPFLCLETLGQIPDEEQGRWQVHLWSGEFLELKEMRERIVAKHRAIQHLLEPLRVVVPQAKALRGSERDPIKLNWLLGLAQAAALLRQRQRPIQATDNDRYLETTEDDLALARNLVDAIFRQNRPAHRPTQRVLTAIQRHLREDPSAVFTRAQVREWAHLSEAAVREYLAQLVSEGQLSRLDGSVGRTFRYQIVYPPQPRPGQGYEVPASQVFTLSELN